jgi:hypothetical protein
MGEVVRTSMNDLGLVVKQDERTTEGGRVLIGESSVRFVVKGQYVRALIEKRGAGSQVRVAIRESTGGSTSEYTSASVLDKVDATTAKLFPGGSKGADAIAKAGPPTGPTAGPDAVAIPSVSASPQAAAFAVVVGIEKYRDLPKPSGARADAEKFAAMLRTTLGLSSDHIRVAVDDRATRTDIEEQLAWLVANTPAGGRAYFFFSGHGAPSPTEGTPYLLPYDATPKAPERAGLSLSSVSSTLASGKAKESLVFVDACFSGAGGRSVLAEGARPLVRVKVDPPKSHVALFAASGPDEISGPLPGGTEGAFSSFLTRALATGEADVDGDGQISLAELSSWVGPRVTRAARDDGRAQTPRLVLSPDVGKPEQTIVAWGYGAKRR